MLIYLAAFLLTALFVRQAAHYYRMSIPKTQGATANECAPAPFLAPNRPKIRDLQLSYIIFFALAVFPLFFIAAVRYDVGTDYFYTYIPNFYSILEGAAPYSEWGFNWLNRFIQLFTHNAQWLIVVTSFIYVFVVIRTVVHCSEYPAVSVIVFLLSCLYFISMNNVRQAVASAFLLAAIPYMVKPRFWKFCLCIFFAFLFHQTAILMIVPFIFVNLKFIRKHFLLFALLITLLLPLLCKLMQMVLMHTKYAYYFVSDFNDNQPTKLNIIYHLFFFILASVYLYPNRMRDKYGFVLLFMQYLAFLASFSSIFIRISEMITRLTVFFSVFQLLLIPHLCALQRSLRGRVFIIGTYVVLYGAYMVFNIVIRGYHQVLPYHWVF